MNKKLAVLAAALIFGTAGLVFAQDSGNTDQGTGDTMANSTMNDTMNADTNADSNTADDGSTGGGDMAQ